jgi:hypothetical protein
MDGFRSHTYSTLIPLHAWKKRSRQEQAVKRSDGSNESEKFDEKYRSELLDVQSSTVIDNVYTVKTSASYQLYSKYEWDISWNGFRTWPAVVGGSDRVIYEKETAAGWRALLL